MNKFSSLLFAFCVACSGSAEDSADTVVAAQATDQPSSQEGTCSLITDAEIGEAIGASVISHEAPTPNQCIYSTAEPMVFIDVELDREDGEAAWRGINAGNAMIEAAQDSLTGIGDEAFFGPRNRLYIKKGGSFAAIEAGFDDKVRERARKVAAVVVAKM